jgi:hypothetical protein
MEVLVNDSPIATLAKRFPQLYVAPAHGAQEAHRLASTRGIVPPDASLDHFAGDDADELRVVATPAGPIDVLYLPNRQDFETFLQIIGHKSMPDTISPTIGAITYSGLPDWKAVRDARDEYLSAGGADWPTEFARLARVPGAFRAQLIVISRGPYSNVSHADVGYDKKAWIDVSREIRLHHECAHVVCRRLMPQDILPVWDELTADVTGLICATGHYDASLAARFLGVDTSGYASGRLEEYLSDEQRPRIDAIAREVRASMDKVEKLSHDTTRANAFDFLLELKRNPFIAY